MSSHKVLIIKHGAIGDIFMSLNALNAIDRKYSDVTLLSTTSGHKTFLEMEFKFKKIIDDRKGFFSTVKILYNIILNKFDIVIDLQNSGRTSFYLFIIKIFSNSISNGTSYFASKRYYKINHNEHVKIGLQNQLRLLNLDLSDDYFCEAKRNINRQVIIVPGTSKSSLSRRWDIKNFLSLINYLSSKKILIYVIGGPEEIEISNLIPNNQFIHNLINKSPWNVVKSIALESIVTITNETAAMHYISSLNLPIIALMQNSPYVLRNAPTSKGSVIISKNNMKDITVEEVICELSKFI